MSDVVGEFARVRDAFGRPTLRLLDSKWAPLRVAMFKISFSLDRRTIAADRLHTQVDVYLGELASAGIEVPTNSTGRTLCLQWMREQWLFRTIGPDGEEYSLTSHALEALDLVQTLSRDRALISESRLNTILDAVRRWALEASPDAGARIEKLTAQISELEAERTRLLEGGESLVASEDRMLDGYMNLRDLIGQLPSDFKRVEESVLGMHRAILRDFREEERPIGVVLDEYLAKTDDLVSSTPEGRAFEGAFVLLRDEALLLDLRENLRSIMEHPFARALATEEAREFLATVSVIRRGTEDVLAQRRRLSATLREHIVNHDLLNERELDEMLRAINRELAQWMEEAGPRAFVPIELMPPTVDFGHMRERLYDPSSAAPPPPLEDVSSDAPDALTLDEILKQGGPSLAKLRRQLVDAFVTGDVGSVGEMFNAMPDELRRPVEILGLLHVIAGVDALDHPDGAETFETVRPDGTRRAFLAPKLSLTAAEAAEVGGREVETV